MRDSDLWELRTLNYLRDDDVLMPPQKVAYDVEYLKWRSLPFRTQDPLADLREGPPPRERLSLGGG